MSDIVNGRRDIPVWLSPASCPGGADRKRLIEWSPLQSYRKCVHASGSTVCIARETLETLIGSNVCLDVMLH